MKAGGNETIHLGKTRQSTSGRLVSKAHWPRFADETFQGFISFTVICNIVPVEPNTKGAEAGYQMKFLHKFVVMTQQNSFLRM